MTGYTTESTLFQRTVLVMAPVLSAISTFFWENGEYGTTGGTILIMALFFWVPALEVLFSLVKHTLPRYAQWGYFIALFGCISGMNFGSLGYYSEALNISHDAYLEALTKYPISSGILLFWAGPLFPISLVVLSVVVWKKRAAATWICICLGLAAITFPVSRISRISLVAHIADLLFLFPMVALAMSYPVAKKTFSV